MFALIVAAIVVVVVVAGTVGGSGGGSAGRDADAGKRSEPRNEYYVVQPGDTFAGIADKEGVPVARLERLNPNLDTQLLPQKGCVNLVPEGCKVLAAGD